jgi:hypothetical protein
MRVGRRWPELWHLFGKQSRAFRKTVSNSIFFIHFQILKLYFQIEAPATTRPWRSQTRAPLRREDAARHKDRDLCDDQDTPLAQIRSCDRDERRRSASLCPRGAPQAAKPYRPLGPPRPRAQQREIGQPRIARGQTSPESRRFWAGCHRKSCAIGKQCASLDGD